MLGYKFVLILMLLTCILTLKHTTSVMAVLGAVLVEFRTLYIILEMKDNARCIKKLYFYGGSYMNIAAH